MIFRVILNLTLECYYLKNKVGVVDYTRACGLVKFQSPQALTGFETLPILRHLQNLLLPVYFRDNVSLYMSFHCPTRTKNLGRYLSIMHVHIKKKTNANTHVMSEANKTDKVD